jgi:hypothetical protein
MAKKARSGRKRAAIGASVPRDFCLNGTAKFSAVQKRKAGKKKASKKKAGKKK